MLVGGKPGADPEADSSPFLYNFWLSTLKPVYFDFIVPLYNSTEYRNFKLTGSGYD